MRQALLRWYWVWRLSRISYPYYLIKTFLHLQWNARKTALALDDTLRAMGQMNHPSQIKLKCKKCGESQVAESKDKECMLMPVDIRSNLINRGSWHALPQWKWRKD